MAMQVTELFHTVPQPIPGIVPNATTLSDIMTTQGRQCLFPFNYLSNDTTSCVLSQNGGNGT